jgi:hypothetical protein
MSQQLTYKVLTSNPTYHMWANSIPLSQRSTWDLSQCYPFLNPYGFSLFQVSSLMFSMNFSTLPCLLHVQSISSSLNLSPTFLSINNYKLPMTHKNNQQTTVSQTEWSNDHQNTGLCSADWHNSEHTFALRGGGREAESAHRDKDDVLSFQNLVSDNRSVKYVVC